MTTLQVVVENRSAEDLDTDGFRSLAVEVLDRLGYGAGELGIAFVTSTEIEELNRRYLGRDGATDVISFPLDDPGEGSGAGIPLLLGDVMICPAVARVNAEALSLSLGEELCRLVIHGILHVRGFDHENDEGEMQSREDELVAGLCPERE